MWLENNSKWLFKYMPFNLNALKILINNELWFGMPDIQNDPLEAEFCLTDSDLAEKAIDFKINLHDELEYYLSVLNTIEYAYYNEEKQDFDNCLKKTIRNYLGICSMSVKCDDILMWAHYADNNEGICLVFDKDILTVSIDCDSDMVNYSDRISRANFYRKGNIGHVIMDKVFCNEKLIHWKHEAEYRFIKRFNEEIPLEDIERTAAFPENALVGIILGEKFTQSNFKTIINLIYKHDIDREFNFWVCRKNIHKQVPDINWLEDKSIFPHAYLNPMRNVLYETKNEIREKFRNSIGG